MDKKVLDYFGGDELASQVWFSKYRLGDEQTPEDTIKRLIGELGDTEIERLPVYSKEQFDNLSEYGKKRYQTLIEGNMKQNIDTLYRSVLGFTGIIPGGSMLQGIGNHEFYSSLSNCFVLGQPFDSYSGITKKDFEQTQVMMRRGGAGIDISTIRPEGSRVSNQSQYSCGPVLFASRYSSSTLEVAQKGRRGALMLSMVVEHPNSLNFAEAKQDLSSLTGCNSSIIYSDEFMQAVEQDADFIQRFPTDLNIKDFVDGFTIHNAEYNELKEFKYVKDGITKTGYLKKIKAKEFWDKTCDYATATAEPGVMFSGNWMNGGTDYVYRQYRPVSSNPCWSGDTPTLTRDGYFEIQSLVGKTVDVWNGKRWSSVTPQITNHNQEMFKITLSDGSIHRCTKYHNWPVWVGFTNKGKEIMTEAQYLKVGDKLSKFNLPTIDVEDNRTEQDFVDLYTQGMYSGDGTTGKNNIRLYGEKIELSQYMNGYLSEGSRAYQNNIEYVDFKVKTELKPKNWIPNMEYSIKSKLVWLSGLIDSDGCVDKQEGGGSCQIGSTDWDFLNNIRLMLTTIGIKSRINVLRDAGYRDMPDQKGGLVNVYCKAGYRLLINASNMQKAVKLGLMTNRVDFTCYNPNVRDASRFITIKSIIRDGIDENVYCFTEPFEHKAIFNGFLIGQCSEIPMQPYDSCRLMSQNIYGLVINPFSNAPYFDWNKAYKQFYEQLTILDVAIDLEIKYIQNIIDKINSGDDPIELKHSEIELWTKIQQQAVLGRRAGAGFTGLGDTLAALGLSYKNNPETIKFLKELFKCKLRAEVDAGIDMAILYGSFDGFSANLEYEKRGENLVGTNKIFQTILNTCGEDVVKKMLKFGRRNVSWSTAAPTGSLSILTQTTSGIEPLFSPFYMRRKKCITPDERVDYIDPADGQKFTVYPVFHPKFKLWIEKQGTDTSSLTEEEVISWFEKSPWFGSKAEDIHWEDRVIIQSIVQKYTTHAISSTINLPSNTKSDVVNSIYLESWKQGLKGNTVYRDGARGGVLVNTKSEPQQNEKEFDSCKSPKRPKSLPAVFHTIKTKDKIYSVVIGLYCEKPYEIFILSDADDLPVNFDPYNDSIVGEIIKESKNYYNFISDSGYLVRDLQEVETKEIKSLSLMMSMAMRHRTPLKYLIKTLDKTQPMIGSFTNQLIKILSKYAPNGEDTGIPCPNPECHDGKLRFDNGCVICPHCGWTKC